jgi:hypothetical protein
MLCIAQAVRRPLCRMLSNLEECCAFNEGIKSRESKEEENGSGGVAFDSYHPVAWQSSRNMQAQHFI